MNLAAFRGLQLPNGFTLLKIELVAPPMSDAIGRPALARAVVEGDTVSIDLVADQTSDELSVSIYHELLEALTVGVPSPPQAVCDLNEAGFEKAAQDAHHRHGLANPHNVLEPIPKPDGVALRIIFVCRKEQAKRLYPLRYCPERRDAAAGGRRRNPLGQNLGGSSGGVASSVTMHKGIAPSSRLANRPAKTLRHLVRLWDRF